MEHLNFELFSFVFLIISRWFSNSSSCSPSKYDQFSCEVGQAWNIPHRKKGAPGFSDWFLEVEVSKYLLATIWRLKTFQVIAAARQTGGLIPLERQERREVRFWAAACCVGHLGGSDHWGRRWLRRKSFPSRTWVTSPIRRDQDVARLGEYIVKYHAMLSRSLEGHVKTGWRDIR